MNDLYPLCKKAGLTITEMPQLSATGEDIGASVEVVLAVDAERVLGRAEKLTRALNWIVNNASSFGLEAEPYVTRAREALKGEE